MRCGYGALECREVAVHGHQHFCPAPSDNPALYGGRGGLGGGCRAEAGTCVVVSGSVAVRAPGEGTSRIHSASDRCGGRIPCICPHSPAECVRRRGWCGPPTWRDVSVEHLGRYLGIVASAWSMSPSGPITPAAVSTNCGSVSSTTTTACPGASDPSVCHGRYGERGSRSLMTAASRGRRRLRAHESRSRA